MDDISIRPLKHSYSKALVCAVSEQGRMWMGQNMGNSIDEVRKCAYQMVVDKELVADLAVAMRNYHLNVDLQI